MVDALLRRYPGYTLERLNSEDAELIRIVRLVELAGQRNADDSNMDGLSGDWEASDATAD